MDSLSTVSTRVTLLEDFSQEMTGKGVHNLEESRGLIPSGTRINVTFLGNEDPQMRLAAARWHVCRPALLRDLETVQAIPLTVGHYPRWCTELARYRFHTRELAPGRIRVPRQAARPAKRRTNRPSCRMRRCWPGWGDGCLLPRGSSRRRQAQLQLLGSLEVLARPNHARGVGLRVSRPEQLAVHRLDKTTVSDRARIDRDGRG
ncbi:hypothetical protein [Streptomyces sp. NPDC056660]|uniref:hypothetical protein n=1 Tax=Streptomyces sp. NPDC056660 TaxID=3345897 RepID=UPI0036886692